MRKKENDGVSVSAVCWMCFIDHDHKRVRKKEKICARHLTKMFLFFQPSSSDAHSLPWSRRHRWTLPSRLRLHARSVSNKFAQRWSRRLFNASKAWRDVHTLRGSSVVSGIGRASGWHLRNVCNLRFHSLHFSSVRDTRKWPRTMNLDTSCSNLNLFITRCEQKAFLLKAFLI
jgi:hypothetical protein